MATIKLKIYVAELANVMSLYDTIEVQRSTTAPPSPTPVSITALVAAQAVLTGSLEGPFLVNGKTMIFKVDGTEVTVTFTSANPSSLSSVVSEVNSALVLAGLNATASASSGRLMIKTDNSGTQYTLEIMSGSALADLGFVIGDKDNGEAAHIDLISGVTSYEFDDGSGLASYYYRTRFYNTTNGTFSGWSDWIQGTTSAAVDAANLIVAQVKLANLDGTALVDRQIVIKSVFEARSSDGYGILGDSVVITTDSAGMAETVLVMGSLVDVVFSGTSIVRRIRVPSTGTEFDLLDDSLVVDDQFNIQVPDLPYAPRSV